jgi:glycerol-3-phosphate O-acyltransferase/dihydroxyacetone phosphate acyltransferase
MEQDNPELLAPVNYDKIRSLTTRMQEEISSRTIDAPSWEIVRTAKLASRIYVPLGTRMSLGDYVRVTRIFVEAFKSSDRMRDANGSSHNGEKIEYTMEDMELLRLRCDLKV